MRTLVFILAIVTSPLAAAVCEVSCADHTVAGHQAPTAPAVVPDAPQDVMAGGHHHHAQMPPETDAVVALTQPAAGATAVLTGSGDDCAPISGQPATIRVATTSTQLASAIAPTVTAALTIDRVGRDSGGPPLWSPPTPLSRSNLPLRI